MYLDLLHTYHLLRNLRALSLISILNFYELPKQAVAEYPTTMSHQKVIVEYTISTHQYLHENGISARCDTDNIVQSLERARIKKTHSTCIDGGYPFLFVITMYITLGQG
jgi:hypothetical protein